MIFPVLGKVVMAKCTKCGADISSAGYDTEELKLPNDTSGYLVSCKHCNNPWNSSREIILAKQ